MVEGAVNHLLHRTEQLERVLREFVEDVQTVYPGDELNDLWDDETGWPDLAETYKKAREVLGLPAHDWGEDPEEEDEDE